MKGKIQLYAETKHKMSPPAVMRKLHVIIKKTQLLAHTCNKPTNVIRNGYVSYLNNSILRFLHESSEN